MLATLVTSRICGFNADLFAPIVVPDVVAGGGALHLHVSIINATLGVDGHIGIGDLKYMYRGLNCCHSDSGGMICLFHCLKLNCVC